MERIERAEFRVGMGAPSAGRPSVRAYRLTEFRELAAFRSAMLSVSLIAEPGSVSTIGRLPLTFQTLEAFQTDPPLDVRGYRHKIAETPEDLERLHHVDGAAE
ncbi:hypothetical protein [Methanopyrus sp.]